MRVGGLMVGGGEESAEERERPHCFGLQRLHSLQESRIEDSHLASNAATPWQKFGGRAHGRAG